MHEESRDPCRTSSDVTAPFVCHVHFALVVPPAGLLDQIYIMNMSVMTGTACGSGSDLAVTLDSFAISEKTGFVPETPPLASLPSYFSKWEMVVGQLSDLLREKTLRDAVHHLPVVEFSENTLHSIEEWRRALIVLSALFQGYMWQEGEAGLPSKMPAILAVPFNEVSQKIGVPLVGVYAANVLYNWYLPDPSQPISADNMPHAMITYTGTEDESWFYMVALLVELEAVPAIKAMWAGISAMEEDNIEVLIINLAIIESSIKAMQHCLSRMSEKCSPQVFYVELRPYFAGTKGLDAFPNGMIYEGIDSKPRQYYGSSAGQSSAIRAIDLYLGVQHSGTDAQFLNAMLDYMPQKHRQFLQYLSKQPSLQHYVLKRRNTELIKQFNATVEAFVNYRSYHVILVTRYITNQKEHSVNASLNTKGTGGTHFMCFLKNVRDNTRAMKI